MKRRTFVKMIGGAAAGCVAAGCTGQEVLTYRPASPVPAAPLPDLPVSAAATVAAATVATATVALVKAANYDRKLVRQQVQVALDALGGVRDIIPPGAAVALKVNLTGGTPCPLAHGVPRTESYWTHPEVVRAIGELLRDAGAQKLYIVEGLFSADSYAAAGYEEIAKSIGAELVDLNSPAPYKHFYKAPVGDGRFIYDEFLLNPVLDNVDALISVPKMKCHWCCGVTVAMKNLVGLVPMLLYCRRPDDGGRSALHVGPHGEEDFKPRLPRAVVDLNRARPIDLALVDGIATMDGGENSYVQDDTHLQASQVLIAGKNAVATDAVATAMMGFDPAADYPNRPFLRAENHLNIAHGLGLGTNRLADISIRGVPIEEVRQKFAPSGVRGSAPFQ
jgi:uncharacterized protein (DUF362 family)